MKMRIDMVVERKADALRRLFAVIAMHASEVGDIRFAQVGQAALGRMCLELEGTGPTRDLLTALLQDPAVREASVTRELSVSSVGDVF